MSTIRVLALLVLVPGATARGQDLVLPESPLSGARVAARAAEATLELAGLRARVEGPPGEDGPGLVIRLRELPGEDAPGASRVLAIPLGAIAPGRRVVAIECGGELVDALVVEARGPRDVTLVERPFSAARIEGRSLTLTRDMPSAGWRFEVEDVEAVGRWIVVRATEVRPAGMAAQAITPTPLTIDLADADEGRRVLVIETRRGRESFRPAQAMAVQLGD